MQQLLLERLLARRLHGQEIHESRSTWRCDARDNNICSRHCLSGHSLAGHIIHNRLFRSRFCTSADSSATAARLTLSTAWKYWEDGISYNIQKWRRTLPFKYIVIHHTEKPTVEQLISKCSTMNWNYVVTFFRVERKMRASTCNIIQHSKATFLLHGEGCSNTHII